MLKNMDKKLKMIYTLKITYKIRIIEFSKRMHQIQMQKIWANTYLLIYGGKWKQNINGKLSQKKNLRI
jgi:hypothetical protein